MSGKALEAWNAYGSYNNLLRAWFVAFGIGVPATFLVNPNLAQHITPPEGDPTIFTAFLVGAGAQVFYGLHQQSDQLVPVLHGFSSNRGFDGLLGMVAGQAIAREELVRNRFSVRRDHHLLFFAGNF